MSVDATPDSEILAASQTQGNEQGLETPRFGLFLCDCNDAEAIQKTLSRIPVDLVDFFEEVVVMLDSPSAGPRSIPKEVQNSKAHGPFPLRFHRPPRASGFGAIRKAAFEYALRKGFDQVIVMRGDTSHPPETLSALVQLGLSRPSQFVLATQAKRHRPEPNTLPTTSTTSPSMSPMSPTSPKPPTRPNRTGPSSMPKSATGRVVHRISAFLQNRILGMQLTDYTASFRLYPTEALARIPFQLASDGPLFDTEIILQLRALGIPIHEAPLIENSPPNDRHEDMTAELLALKTAVGYRLHQLHITRDGRYLVDHDIHYTLKRSRTGSHSQIIDAIKDGTAVLDLGCSNGLLARPLLEKKVQVTGVDAGPGERLAEELAEYYQRDLDLPLDLPYGRVFDYVVCADVIEHLRNRTQLLRGARRYLKPDGRLIISTPNIALWFYRLSLLVGRFEYGPRGVLDETHVHLYTGSTFRREIEKAGFTIIQQRVTSLPFEVVFQSTGRSRIVRGIESTYHFLARLWPSMFAYQHILEAQITTLDEESTTESDSAPAS